MMREAYIVFCELLLYALATIGSGMITLYLLAYLGLISKPYAAALLTHLLYLK
jgi:hypothetical protein